MALGEGGEMKIKKSFAIEMSEEEYKYFGDALRHLEEMLGEDYICKHCADMR